MGLLSTVVGEMYSIVTMDPDVPSPTVGTQERPLLHGLIINIRDGNVGTGKYFSTSKYSNNGTPESLDERNSCCHPLGF